MYHSKFMILPSVLMCSKYTFLLSCVDLFRYQTTKSPYIHTVQQILNKMLFTLAIKLNISMCSNVKS